MDVAEGLRTVLSLPSWVYVGLLILLYIARVSQLLALSSKLLAGTVRWIRARRRLRSASPEARRAQVLARFADDQLERLARIDRQENWSDARFTELEAEVETDAAGTRRPLLPKLVSLGLSAPHETKRERSLTQALERTSTRVAFLHGDAGAGKSVALRRVARHFAERASLVVRDDTVIPLYVNLKTLVPGDDGVNPQLIRDFVLDALRHRATEETRTVLAEEFGPGLLSGRWLFLFDSFDEIPEVLASTDLDESVRAYADAIRGFLQENQNTCRAVLASREFRAPPDYGWPTFTIVRLSPKRQRELISQTDLEPADQALIIRELPRAGDDIVELASSPLFLSLLCDFASQRHAFPQSPTDVYEQFIGERLARDEDRLRRQGFSSDRVRIAAEQIAFTIMASELGLAGDRTALLERRLELGFAPAPSMPNLLDALGRLGLAKRRDTEAAEDSDDERFEFIFRRLQEYFTTSLLLRDPARFDVELLLFDDRWRETAVTLCQGQGALAEPVLTRAAEFLDESAGSDLTGAAVEPDAPERKADFDWPPKLLHVLGLLQAAFPPASEDVPHAIREPAGRILRAAFDSGWVHHQRWALEVSGMASDQVLEDLVRRGFSCRSSWLRDGAYQQIGRLRRVPPDLARDIRRALISLLADRALRRERSQQEVQLARLAEPRQFIRALKVLSAAKSVDLVTHLSLSALLLVGSYSQPFTLLIFGVMLRMSYLALFDLAFEVATTAHHATAKPKATTLDHMRRAYSSLSSVISSPRLVRERLAALRASLTSPASRSPISGWSIARLIARGFITVLLALFVVALVVDPSTGSTLGLVLTLALIYGMSWPAAALLAVRRGEFLGPLASTAAHLSLLNVAIRRLRSVPPGLIVLVVIFLVLSTVLAELLGRIQIENPTAQLVMALLVLGLGVGVVIATVVYLVRNSLRDWWWLRRHDFEAPLDQREFLTVLGEQRTPGGLVHVVAAVRAHDALRDAGDLVPLVLDLQEAATFVPRSAGDAWLEAVPPWRSALVAGWLNDDLRSRLRLLRLAGPDLLDELGRLVHMQADRDRRLVAA